MMAAPGFSGVKQVLMLPEKNTPTLSLIRTYYGCQAIHRVCLWLPKKSRQ